MGAESGQKRDKGGRIVRRWVVLGITLWVLAVLSVALPGRAQPVAYCDGGCSAQVAEVVPVLSIALGTAGSAVCPAADRDEDATVDVADVVVAIRAARYGDVCQTPVGVCGDGVLDPTEQCDGPADAACPGRCQPATSLAFDCVACGSRTGACSGPVDPACSSQCVLRTTSCTCAPSPPASCPPPQVLPDPGAPYFCYAPCAQIGARLYYREDRAGGQFTEQEIEVVDFVIPDESAVRVHVRTTNQDGSTTLDTVLDFGGGSGGIVLPPAANAIWGTLAMYPQLVCGWPLGCAPDGSVLIPNGQQYAFTADLGFGQSVDVKISCSGCGGGTTRVNASWAGARCGVDPFTQHPVLCRGFNPYAPTMAAPQCCGCTGDGPCTGGTTCVNDVCQ